MNTSYHALNTGMNGKHLKPMWIHLAFACFVTALLVHLFDKLTLTVNDAYSVSVTFRNKSSEVAFDDPNPFSPWPRIAWLMSYPNSVNAYFAETE